MGQALSEMDSAKGGEGGAAYEDGGVDAGDTGKERPLDPRELERRESEHCEESDDETHEKREECDHQTFSLKACGIIALAEKVSSVECAFGQVSYQSDHRYSELHGH